jgi:hypothetical protein
LNLLGLLLPQEWVCGENDNRYLWYGIATLLHALDDIERQNSA